MFDVALNWERCPDGVELHDYGSATEASQSANNRFAIQPVRDGRQFRARSERRVPVQLEAVNLNHPLALRFINARDEDDLAVFFSRFGMLTTSDHDRVELMLSFKESFRQYAARCLKHSPADKAGVINEKLLKGMMLRPEFDYSDDGKRGRVALYADNMTKFMSAELAVAVLSDVKLVQCANCDDLFLTGPAAKRRSDAKTCSDKCRVNLMRRNRCATARA